jgi:hypothetical protein
MFTLFGLTTAAPVFAEPSAAEKETARSLMDEGDKLVAAGQAAQALERYRAAHQIMGVPTTGLELAKTESQLGFWVEARATALSVVRIPVVAGEPSVYGSARTRAEALAEELAARIPTLVIQLTPTVAAATVSVDEVVLPPAALGLPYKANPGPHVVSAQAAGYDRAASEVVLTEGQQGSLVLTLIPSTAAVAAQPTLPAEPAAATPTDTPPAAEGASNTLAYVSLGVAGVGATVGAVTGIMSLGQKSDAEKFCHGNVCSREAKESIDSSRALATAANLGFGVAIVAGAFGVWQLLTSDSPSNDRATPSHRGFWRVTVNPYSTPNASGPILNGATVDLAGAL